LTVTTIDLNCDLGEGAPHDAEIMPLVSSANIACGVHAGDAALMLATVELAVKHGVAIGAHPSLDDRENFGRRELPVTPEEVKSLVVTQTRFLQAVARQAGGRVRHVKPHGALYNMSARDRALADAVAEGVASVDRSLVLFGLAGSQLIAAGRAHGLAVANEVFADRTYQADGSLTPRSRPDAFLDTSNATWEQVHRIVREGCVRATSGELVRIAADTICIHGDGRHALFFAQRLRRELRELKVAVKAVTA
jgi:5-oxoprolinase (ATP-hydrolysing) subunit A